MKLGNSGPIKATFRWNAGNSAFTLERLEGATSIGGWHVGQLVPVWEVRDFEQDSQNRYTIICIVPSQSCCH